MKAAFYDKQGPASDVLNIGELPDPEPRLGEVRIRVAVSGINPSDIKTRTGFAGVTMPYKRIVPHQDGAGVIDRVGPGVPESRLGEKVWIYEAQTGRSAGTAAQYVVVPATNAIALPKGVSFEVAACLGIPALTAHRCLFADGELRGKKVLVQGGAGAVGTAAILLAKWAGAWVATTVSRPEQEAAALGAGADLVINRRTQDVAAVVRRATDNTGVDRIVDVDLIVNLETDLACLAPSGVISAYATEVPSAVLSIPFLRAMFSGFVFRYVFVYSMPEEARREAIKDVNACLAAGAYRPVIGMRVPLERLAEAHEAQESGRVVGKIVVDISE
jgi:NADPH2:quinone reductase